jgi:protein gp37
MSGMEFVERGADMDTAEAKEFVEYIHGVQDEAPRRVIDAYQRRAWLALGYASWAEMCEREDLRLPREVTPELRAGGLSIRAIAAVQGIHPMTVHRDMKSAGVAQGRGNATPAPVTGLDGKTYSSNRPQEPQPAPEPDEPEVLDAPCEACGAPIEQEEADAGYRRCEKCDSDGEHYGDPDGPCKGCNPTPKPWEQPADEPAADPLPAPIAEQIERRIAEKTAPRPAPVMLTLLTNIGTEVPYPKPAGKATFNETTGEGISWAAWSWNPVTGCLHGCDYCYARAIAHRFTDGFPAGFTPLFHHERLDAPANTTIPAARRDDPAYRRVFVCSMADLYGRWVPDEWINQVHASMLAAPQWEYLLLTKFPARYVGLEMPPGAWLGTSVDEQKRVRIAQEAFAKVEGVKVKWLSLEPLREPLKFDDLSMFDWVVIGAQTETRQPDGTVPAFAPPAEWVVRITQQAKDAGCKVHWKPNLRTNPGMRWLDEYPGDN